jgi:hypothetical protein
MARADEAVEPERSSVSAASQALLKSERERQASSGALAEKPAVVARPNPLQRKPTETNTAPGAVRRTPTVEPMRTPASAAAVVVGTNGAPIVD